MCSKAPSIKAPPPPPPAPPPPAETASLDVKRGAETDGSTKKKQGKASLRVQRQAGIGGATAAGLSIPKG